MTWDKKGEEQQWDEIIGHTWLQRVSVGIKSLGVTPSRGPFFPSALLTSQPKVRVRESPSLPVWRERRPFPIKCVPGEGAEGPAEWRYLLFGGLMLTTSLKG